MEIEKVEQPEQQAGMLLFRRPRKAGVTYHQQEQLFWFCQFLGIPTVTVNIVLYSGLVESVAESPAKCERGSEGDLRNVE